MKNENTGLKPMIPDSTNTLWSQDYNESDPIWQNVNVIFTVFHYQLEKTNRF